MFIGRSEEIEILHRFLKEEGHSAFLLYGRRRIGKTELIQEALAQYQKQLHFPDSPLVLYYECKDAGADYNFQSLSAEVRELLNAPRLSFQNVEDLLDYLFEQSQNIPMVLVLDEYPFLRRYTDGIDSILKSVMDKWKHKTKLKLILSGSYIDVMESLLEKQNPLHGRFSYQMKLEEMDYYDAAKFYPDFSLQDKIRLYSVFGGVPYYNSLIRQDQSAEKNIQNLIASKNAQLSTEISLLLSSELQKLANANEVFSFLAQGITRFKKLEDKVSVGSKSLTNVLNKLLDLGLIEKETPVNDPSNPKKTMYKIKDRLSLFYYTYIFKNSSRLSRLSTPLFWKYYVQDHFDSQYVPKCFERVCRQYLIRANNAGLIDPPFMDIGTYYYDLPEERTNGEFDNVTLDPQGYIFYESKFTSSPLDASQVEREIEQVRNCGLFCRKFGFISRSGFTAPSLPDRIFIELADLFDPQLERPENGFH